MKHNAAAYVMKKNQLRITELFYSIQGESTLVGLPTIFIRLTGCPLRCHYCDTEYAFKGGNMMSINDILQQVKSYNTRYITVTGGEPLAQPACMGLLTQLCDQNYCVSLETSGAIDTTAVDTRVIKIIDIKTPASGEVQRNRWSNFQQLQTHDQIKFVICDETDYLFAKQVLDDYSYLTQHTVLFSPSYQQLAIHDLAEWILRDQLPVRLQTQLHKVVWGDQPGK